MPRKKPKTPLFESHSKQVENTEPKPSGCCPECGHLLKDKRDRDSATWVPQFTRSLDYKSACGTYGLFFPVEKTPDTTVTRVLGGLQQLTGVHPGLMSSAFREQAQVLLREEEVLRRSTLRALLFGDIPSVAQPVITSRIRGANWHRVRQSLAMMDVLETMVYRHLKKVFAEEGSLLGVTEVEDEPVETSIE